MSESGTRAWRRPGGRLSVGGVVAASVLALSLLCGSALAGVDVLVSGVSSVEGGLDGPDAATLGLLRGGADPAGAACIRPYNLRIEYLGGSTVVGLSNEKPNFVWALQSVSGAAGSMVQTGYRVVVSVRRGDSWAGVWDTKDVVGQSSPGPVEYGGPALATHTRYQWKVRVIDGEKRGSEWITREFVTGVMSAGASAQDPWAAMRWIQAPGTKQDTLTERFRKAFEVRGAVRAAFVSVCGLGVHVLEVNGQPLDREKQTPFWTNYKKTCLYSTYDVTSLLTTGTNAVGVSVASGMYNVPQPPNGRYTKFVGSQGERKMVLLLTVETADGERTQVGSDTTWTYSTAGPVTFSHVYAGEDHDARREQAGWSTGSFKEGAGEWAPAVEAGPTPCKLVGAYIPPITVAETEVAKAAPVQAQPGQYIYDMARNGAGWPVIAVEGPAGAVVRVTPSELLDETFGNATQVSMTDGGGRPIYFDYTLKGVGVEVWHPQFMYTGFRYVQVEGAAPPGTPAAAAGAVVVHAVSAERIHSSSAKVGSFETSSPDLNAVHSIIVRAVESNMQSVFTDCPHREKLGWLEELNLQRTALVMNYDVAALMSKVIRDMEEAQTPDGLIPDIAPEYIMFDAGFRDSPEWGSSSIMVAHTLYALYGHAEVLRSHYPSMVAYMDYLGSKATDHCLLWGLMDWISLQDSAMGVTATMYYYLNALKMSDIATALDKAPDAAKYTALAADIVAAFNGRYYDADNMVYGTGNQTDMAIPYTLGFADQYGEVATRAIYDKVVEDVKARGGTTGEIGYGYMMKLLSDKDMNVFYTMAMRPDKPSYKFNLNHDATSMTETWQADREDSWNHFMLGHIEDWFYTVLAGLSLDGLGTAGRHFAVSPRVPLLNRGADLLGAAGLDPVRYVKAAYESAYGLIRSEWKVAAGGPGGAAVAGVVYTIEIPPNTTADITLECQPAEAAAWVPAARAGTTDDGAPAAYTRTVGPGVFTFTC